MLKKRFGEEVVFNTTIGRSVRMPDATVRGQTIFELPEAQVQAQQFLTLVHQMLNRGSRKKDQTLNPLAHLTKIRALVVEENGTPGE